MMNDNQLSDMRNDLFQMVSDLYHDDPECEGNQILASQIMVAVETIEAELSLRESGVFA